MPLGASEETIRAVLEKVPGRVPQQTEIQMPRNAEKYLNNSESHHSSHKKEQLMGHTQTESEKKYKQHTPPQVQPQKGKAHGAHSDRETAFPHPHTHTHTPFHTHTPV